MDGPMRVSRLAPFLALALAAVAGAVAAATSRPADWDEPLVLVMLLAMALVADRIVVVSRSGAPLVGSLPVFVLAAVLFGPAPAAAIAVGSSLIQRKSWRLIAIDVGAYGTFPLITGLAAREALSLASAWADLWSVLIAVGAYMIAWTLNFFLITLFMRLERGRPMQLGFNTIFRPLFSTQLAHGVATAALVYGYIRLGAAAIALAGVLIITYSRLQRDLMQAERLRDEAQERNEELAAANERLRRSHMGAMRSLVRSIHLHDQMTARHSAAVARYARAIAAAAGCSDHEQHLVHTAGLLHDVGKHILDDAILKGDTKLNDSQWELVKRHPEEGARLVRMLEGHEDVAEIIHAHHERIDGRGYPRGITEHDIPLLSRMISIADTYDVMTARDSYREPVLPSEAVAELRRVSGAQLDGRLVEIFIHDVLGHAETAFGHGDDADFEAELEFGPLGGRPGDDEPELLEDDEQPAHAELTAVA
jgi:putative nucleotidyltransferase with HDIG domain